MKSIDGIKIIQVDGLNRGSAAGDANTGNVGGGNRRNKRYQPHSLTAHRHR